MKVEILATKVEINDALRTYVQKKMKGLSRLVSRFEKERELTVFVEIARTTKHHRSGEVYYAEATLELPGTVLRAEEKHLDMRAAIDGMKNTLKLEIKKYKDQTVSRRRGK